MADGISEFRVKEERFTFFLEQGEANEFWADTQEEK
jgi:hypothetical protein